MNPGDLVSVFNYPFKGTEWLGVARLISKHDDHNYTTFKDLEPWRVEWIIQNHGYIRLRAGAATRYYARGIAAIVVDDNGKPLFPHPVAELHTHLGILGQPVWPYKSPGVVAG